MSKSDVVDYGPLAGLIGLWKGDKGVDVSPEPDGEEQSTFYETLNCTAAGAVRNAESQCLSVVHYHLVVVRHSNNEVFHNQTGYWMWDADTQTIMYSLSIPRAVSVLAGGGCKASNNGTLSINVSASHDDKEWQIIQSPFMRDNASTQAYQLAVKLSVDDLSYSQTTLVDIYGKTFKHTDQNTLQRQ